MRAPWDWPIPLWRLRRWRTRPRSWATLPLGADGIQNELTPAEIADADIIIHAVAIAPQNNERFDSYDIYEIGLQDAIKNAKGIIQEIESMEA